MYPQEIEIEIAKRQKIIKDLSKAELKAKANMYKDRLIQAINLGKGQTMYYLVLKEAYNREAERERV